MMTRKNIEKFVDRDFNTGKKVVRLIESQHPIGQQISERSEVI